MLLVLKFSSAKAVVYCFDEQVNLTPYVAVHEAKGVCLLTDERNKFMIPSQFLLD